MLPDEVAEITPRTWYLPHFGVLNSNKPGKLDESVWPNQINCPVANDEDLQLQPIRHTLLTIRGNPIQFNFVNSSSYFKVLRTAGWIVRFVMNLKAKSSGMDLHSGELKVDEIRKAETLIFRIVQMEVFQEEYDLLSRNMPVSKTSDIYQLSPVLDEKGD